MVRAVLSGDGSSRDRDEGLEPMSEPSRFARMTRIPSRSDQYGCRFLGRGAFALGCGPAPGGTIVVMFVPSRFARRMKPSSELALPMLVQ